MFPKYQDCWSLKLSHLQNAQKNRFLNAKSLLKHMSSGLDRQLSGESWYS